MTMDYKDRQSVVSFQDTLKAEGVCKAFWLVKGEDLGLICYFNLNLQPTSSPDWITIPLSEILHSQSEALEKVRAARIIHQNF